jgi:hypothetical protein
MVKRKKTVSQLKMKFSKRGENATRASKIYRASKDEWGKIFNSEVNKEKTKKKPDMPTAAKRASKLYSSKRMTWGQAMQKASKSKSAKK